MKMQKVITVLNSVSKDLHDLTLNAVFSNDLLDNEKINVISNIKSNIYKVSDVVDHAIIDNSTINVLDKVINDCIASIHEINTNMKFDLIQQNAEDSYAELSAQVVYVHEQIERIKNS